jgi:hypothetical protein
LTSSRTVNIVIYASKRKRTLLLLDMLRSHPRTLKHTSVSSFDNDITLVQCMGSTTIALDFVAFL